MNGIINIARRQASSSGGAAPVNLDFVSTWDTTKAGSASDTVVIPLLSGGTYSGTIDWGDGSTSALSYANRTHVYASSGIYNVTISGQIDGWRFGNGGDRRKITDISNWGTLNITLNWAFYGCNNLDVTATDAPTISTTSLDNSFRDCTALTTPDFSNWDVSGVTNMTTLFGNCSNFNGNITTWDVSNVTTFVYDAAGFIIGMFSNCSLFNQDIGGWDVSSCTNLSGMFTNCRVFDQDLSNWNMSNKTSVKAMFAGCYKFNNGGSDGIKDWDVSNVQYFGVTTDSPFGMFTNAREFNQPIGSWNMSSALDITNMFRDARDFNQNIGAWNLSSCTSMYRTFDAVTQVLSFNNGGSSTINNWNVSTVTNMNFMFRKCSSFNQPIDQWDVNQVTGLISFMQQVTLSTANYDALLIAWDAQGAMSFSGTAHFGSSKYTAGGAAEAARTSLISKWGGIIDGGPA